MEKYVFFFTDSQKELKNLSPNEIQLYLEKWLTWIRGLKENSIYIAGEPVEATGRQISGRKKVVTVLSDDMVREFVTGFILIRARDVEHAVAIGLDCPIYEVDGKLAIHQVREMED